MKRLLTVLALAVALATIVTHHTDTGHTAAGGPHPCRTDNGPVQP